MRLSTSFLRNSSVPRIGAAIITMLLTGIGNTAPLQPFVAPQLEEPPTAVKATAQAWLIFQDWYCRPSNLSPSTFVNNIRGRMTSVASGGWELVNFSPAPIAGQECFVATFKAPRR